MNARASSVGTGAASVVVGAVVEGIVFGVLFGGRVGGEGLAVGAAAGFASAIVGLVFLFLAPIRDLRSRLIGALILAVVAALSVAYLLQPVSRPV